MLRVLIIDDEALAAKRLARLCARLENVAVVGMEGDGEAALDRIEKLRADVVLLAISLPGLDGMALARTLAARERHPAIVFVTAHSRFAVTAFEIAATDYLLKPVSLPRLQLALSRVAASRPPSKSTYLTEIWAPSGREIIRLGIEVVDLIEAERDYVRLYAKDHNYLLRTTLQDLERQLDPSRFVRVHRSAMVALGRIRAFKTNGGGAWAIELMTGHSVRVGRSFRSMVRRIIAAPA